MTTEFNHLDETREESTRKLYEQTQKAVKILGIDSQNVIVGSNGIVILGTGLMMQWSQNAMGKNKPGWIILQEYHSFNILTHEGEIREKTIGKFSSEDAFFAVKASIHELVDQQLNICLSK